MPHSIFHGDACFAYFNKNWGIPLDSLKYLFVDLRIILYRANDLSVLLHRKALISLTPSSAFDRRRKSN